MKIKAGAIYPDKKGGAVGPMERTQDREFPWRGKTRGGDNDGAYSTYTDEGRYTSGLGDSPDDLDLAAYEAACKADRLKVATELLQRLFDHIGDHCSDREIYSDVFDFLRIEKDPDPADYAAQRADHQRKVDEEH